jgi:hypothetical protein
MDSQLLFNVVTSSFVVILGWFARELWAAIKTLQFDLTKITADLPKNYVLREDYRSDLREIKEMLNKIFDKLDGKVDKD